MNLFDGLMGSDFNDPKTLATMQLAAGLLGGAGASRNPQSFGGLLGAGLTGYQNTMSAAAKQRLLEEELGIKRSEFDMMKSDRERKMEAEKRALEQRQQMEATIQKMDPTGRLWLAYQADPKVVAEQLFPKIESPYSKIDPKDYTPESFAAFEASRSPMNQNGDRTLLRAARPVSFVNGKAVDPYATPPGTTINDPNKPFGIGPDGQPVANSPYQTYAERVAAAGASRSNATIKNYQETEENKVVGRGYGEQFNEIQKAGFNAGKKQANFDMMHQLLEGVNTGKLTPAGTEVAAWLASIGINIDPKLGNKQAAITLTNQMTMEARNPSGGAGMPGAMSNSDREFLRAIPPGIDKTPKGNQLIREVNMRILKRDAEIARLANEYRQRTGKFDGGFFKELKAWSDANPLFLDLGGAVGGGAKVIDFSSLPRR